MQQIVPMIGGALGSKALAAAFGGSALAGNVGWFLGQAAFSMLMPKQKVSSEGSRLSNLSVQSSAYGVTIPLVFGTVKLAGNVIWARPLHEVRSESSTSTGKGGMGVNSKSVTYTYFGRFAVALCEGPIQLVSRIWANGELIFENGKYFPDGSTTAMNINGALPDDGVQLAPGIRLFFGTETQLPSAYIESFEGIGQVPAHRGLAYLVFEDFALEKYGNAVPTFEFELSNYVAVEAPVTQTADPTPVAGVPANAAWISDYDQATGLLALYVKDSADQPLYVQRATANGDLVIDTVPLPDLLTAATTAQQTTIAAVGGYVYLVFWTYTGVYYVKVALSTEGAHQVVAANTPGAPTLGPWLSVENGGLPDCVAFNPTGGYATIQHADNATLTAYSLPYESSQLSDAADDSKVYSTIRVGGAQRSLTTYFVPLRTGEQLTNETRTNGAGISVELHRQLDQPVSVTPLGWTESGQPAGGWVAVWSNGDVATFDETGLLLKQQAVAVPSGVIYSRNPFIDVARKQLIYPGSAVELWEL